MNIIVILVILLIVFVGGLIIYCKHMGMLPTDDNDNITEYIIPNQPL